MREDKEKKEEEEEAKSGATRDYHKTCITTG